MLWGKCGEERDKGERQTESRVRISGKMSAPAEEYGEDVSYHLCFGGLKQNHDRILQNIAIEQAGIPSIWDHSSFLYPMCLSQFIKLVSTEGALPSPIWKQLLQRWICACFVPESWRTGYRCNCCFRGLCGSGRICHVNHKMRIVNASWFQKCKIFIDCLP